MELITIKFRTQKSAGKVKLRFRLRDGRGVDIYHKSDIEVDISLMDKLTLEGTKKKGVSTLNPRLLSSIAEEKDLMSRAYAQMKKDGRDLTSEVLEEIIDVIKHPVEEQNHCCLSVTDRFRRFAKESLRDRILGKKR